MDSSSPSEFENADPADSTKPSADAARRRAKRTRLRRRILGVLASGILCGFLSWFLMRPLGLTPDAIYVTGLLVLLGFAIGLMGIWMTSAGRACLAGAAMSCIWTVTFAFQWGILGKFGERIWFIAAIASVAGLCAEISCVIAGPWVPHKLRTTESPPPLQFSILQMLWIFIPVAVYFGYVSHVLNR
jgi:hypothetical protein